MLRQKRKDVDLQNRCSYNYQDLERMQWLHFLEQMHRKFLVRCSRLVGMDKL